jgi:tetratricopeptide (TPR) repeat protein
VITLILALGCAILAWCGIYFSFDSRPWGWASTAAIAAFLAASAPITLMVRKRMERIFLAVQTKILGSQEQLRRKVLALQHKMQSGAKFQSRIEKEQAESIREAIELLEPVKDLQKWNLLAMRQYNTFKGQLLFQIRDFDAARPLLAKALVVEPLTAAMQMVLMYKNEEMKELEKTFYKGTGRFKDEKGSLLYGLYSWILLKENRLDEAIAILDEGRKKCENPVLERNWEHLVNGRSKRFSNADLGEQWFALHLESMPQQRVRPQDQFGGKIRRGGFR